MSHDYVDTLGTMLDRYGELEDDHARGAHEQPECGRAHDTGTQATPCRGAILVLEWPDGERRYRCEDHYASSARYVTSATVTPWVWPSTCPACQAEGRELCGVVIPWTEGRENLTCALPAGHPGPLHKSAGGCIGRRGIG